MSDTDRRVTLCVTMGNRPDLLRRTLESLLAHNRFDDVVAVNDFGDEATNAVFRAVCPTGRLVSPGEKLGHHGAVDRMYETVTTPYVFHCEDDWLFEPRPLLDTCFRLLDAVPRVAGVCVRSSKDCRRIWNLTGQGEADGLTYRFFNDEEADWGGFGFNPNLQRLELWKTHGPWSRFRQEVHISRALNAEGLRYIYATPGFCRHIGKNHSVSRMTTVERLRRSLQKRWPQIFGLPDPNRE